MNKKVLSATIKVCAAFFSVLFVIGFAGNSAFGWFSNNKDVTANGMQVSVVNPNIDVYYKLSTETDADYRALNSTEGLTLSDITIPGSSVTINLQFVNNNDDDRTVKAFGFSAPTADEDPEITYESKEYHVGTQITAYLGEDTTNKKYLAQYVDSDKNYGEINYTNVALYSDDTGFTLAANGGTATYNITITFENKEEDQTMYKKATCKRRIYVQMAE